VEQVGVGAKLYDNRALEGGSKVQAIRKCINIGQHLFRRRGG